MDHPSDLILDNPDGTQTLLRTTHDVITGEHEIIEFKLERVKFAGFLRWTGPTDGAIRLRLPRPS